MALSILLDCPRSRWLSTLSYISRERFEVVNKRRLRTGKGTISFMCRRGTLTYFGVYSCFYSIPSYILPVYLGDSFFMIWTIFTLLIKKKVLLMFANVRLMFVVFHFFRHVTQSLVQRKLYLVVIFN